MKKLGKKRMGTMKSLIVARGCYCGSLCTCYNTPTVSANFTAKEAAEWMTSEIM